MTDEDITALVDDQVMLTLAEDWARYTEPYAESAINLAKWVLKLRSALQARIATVEAERDQLKVSHEYEQFYTPERHGRRCVEHPNADHELVCLTCMASSEASLSEAEMEARETHEG